MDWIASQQLSDQLSENASISFVVGAQQQGLTSSCHDVFGLAILISVQVVSGKKKNQQKPEGMLSQSAASTSGRFCWHPFSCIVKYGIYWPLLVLPPIYVSSLG